MYLHFNPVLWECRRSVRVVLFYVLEALSSSRFGIGGRFIILCSRLGRAPFELYPENFLTSEQKHGKPL
jgi:hypothetical protein